MNNSVYQINKAINKPVQFRGFKAQYIWYLAGALLGLLVLFALLFILGVNTFICLGLVFTLGIYAVTYIHKLSHKYGEFGIMKKLAKRSVPKSVKLYSRKEFTGLKKQPVFKNRVV